MKTHRPRLMGRRESRAFTLIELLVVIAIISILAALTMGTFAFAQQSASRNRTSGSLSSIVNALEQYKERFGEYPEAGNPAIMGSGNAESMRIGGSLMLYQAITGDGYEYIKDAANSNPPGPPASNGIVEPDERGNSIRGDLPKSMVFNSSSGYLLIDGFGHPFQYEKGGSPNAVNSTFDIWSTAQQEPNKYGDITSKEMKDGTVKLPGGRTPANSPWIKNW